MKKIIIGLLLAGSVTIAHAGDMVVEFTGKSAKETAAALNTATGAILGKMVTCKGGSCVYRMTSAAFWRDQSGTDLVQVHYKQAKYIYELFHAAYRSGDSNIKVALERDEHGYGKNSGYQLKLWKLTSAVVDCYFHESSFSQYYCDFKTIRRSNVKRVITPDGDIYSDVDSLPYGQYSDFEN